MRRINSIVDKKKKEAPPKELKAWERNTYTPIARRTLRGYRK